MRDGTPLFRCPKCGDHDVRPTHGGMQCDDCGYAWAEIAPETDATRKLVDVPSPDARTLSDKKLLVLKTIARMP